MPTTALGLYIVAVSAASIGRMLSGAVQTVAMPAIARESTVEGRRKVCERVFSRYWLVSILIMLTLGVVAVFVIQREYGWGFRPSVAPAEILLIAALFMGAKGVLGGSVAAPGDPRLVSKANVLAPPVTAVLPYPLLPRFGLLGAAIASAATYFAELSPVVYGLRRKHSISPANLFRF